MSKKIHKLNEKLLEAEREEEVPYIDEEVPLLKSPTEFQQKMRQTHNEVKWLLSQDLESD